VTTSGLPISPREIGGGSTGSEVFPHSLATTPRVSTTLGRTASEQGGARDFGTPSLIRSAREQALRPSAFNRHPSREGTQHLVVRCHAPRENDTAILS
jgi:hypothetical protein